MRQEHICPIRKIRIGKPGGLTQAGSTIQGVHVSRTRDILEFLDPGLLVEQIPTTRIIVVVVGRSNNNNE